MRILLLNFEFPPIGGGGSYACRNIVKELSDNGVMVDVVTSSPDNKFRVEKIGRNATTYRLNVNKKDVHYWKLLEIIRFSFKHWLFVGKILRKNNYDLCHVFFTVPCGGIALWYKLWNRLPYIVSIRGSDVPGFDSKRWSWLYPILKPIIRMIWRNAKAVVSNSDGLRKLAYQTAPRQKITVIYNGINVGAYKHAKKHKGITVLSTSRLIKRKGINYLIQAIADASKIFPNIKLILVGEGNRETEYKALARKLNIMDKVRFEGYVAHERIKKFYSESDMFVLASTNEGMSNSLLEAMASGLPIIATDTGGTKELIKGNGIIIPMEDSDAIAKAIIRLASNKKLMEDMGSKSLEIAKGLDWSRIAEQYMKVYEKVRK